MQDTLKVSTALCFVSGWTQVEHWQFSLVIRTSSSRVPAICFHPRVSPEEKSATVHSS